MSQDMESVLKRVASGELTPEEALELLDQQSGKADEPIQPSQNNAAEPAPVTGATSSEPIFGTPGTPMTPRTAIPLPAGLQRLKVNSSYRSLEIVGDPEVAQALVTGEHSVQLQDGVMVVTTPGPWDSDNEAPLFSFSALPRTLNWIRSWRDRRVRIRVNPAIPLELDLTGVELNLSGMTGVLTARINASAAKLDHIKGAIDLQTFSASLKGSVVILGNSQLVSESSSVRLTLAAGSDVRVEATSRMGRLNLPDDAGVPRDGETSRFSVGSGENLLTVDSVMSSVSIDTPSWAKSA
jgi:hypothetical protein